jgi:hypothetical protein
VRAGLEAVGLTSDPLLQHGNPRLVFVVPLASNFREVLIGLEKRARSIVPKTDTANKAVVDFWRKRWLSRRILVPEVLERVQLQTLVYPIRHRARVALPPVAGEDGPLFLKALEETGLPIPAPKGIMPRDDAPRLPRAACAHD